MDDEQLQQDYQPVKMNRARIISFSLEYVISWSNGQMIKWSNDIEKEKNYLVCRQEGQTNPTNLQRVSFPQVRVWDHVTTSCSLAKGKY